MKDLAIYILNVNIALVLCYMAYFLLKKETFFSVNRNYLIYFALASVFVPLLIFIKINAGEFIPTSDVLNLRRIISAPDKSSIVSNAWNIYDYLLLAYFTGIVFFFLRFLVSLYKIYELIKKGKKIYANDYVLVTVEQTGTAFSFGKYVFISPGTEDVIIQHELLHVKCKHSYDIVFYELLSIAFWFNPVCRLLQNELREVHEFIVDEMLTKHDYDKGSYAQLILQQTINNNTISITNGFISYSFLKNRLLMLSKKRSANVNKLKYLLVVPLVIVVAMVVVSCTDNEKVSVATLKVQPIYDTIMVEDINQPGKFNQILVEVNDSNSVNQAIDASIKEAIKDNPEAINKLSTPKTSENKVGSKTTLTEVNHPEPGELYDTIVVEDINNPGVFNQVYVKREKK